MIDHQLALAHYADGLIHRAKGEHEEVLSAFCRAIEFDPNFARAYAQKACELIDLGRPDEAPPLVEKAIELSPRNPSLGMFYWNLGRAHFFANRHRDAIPWLKESIRIRPNLWNNWLYFVAYALVGEQEEAEHTLIDFDNYPLFENQKLTLKLVESFENVNPSDKMVISEGPEKFHEGLLKSGIEEG